MNHEELRQLVKIRHELRRLLPAGNTESDRQAARRLLDRMQALTAPHMTERAHIEPELTRWHAAFGTGG
jgi:hypothetical protein